VAVRKSGKSPGTGKTGSKSSGKGSRKGRLPLGVLFWLAFFIVMAGLFLVNREVIRRTLRSTGIFSGSSDPDAPENTPDDSPAVTVSPPAGGGDSETAPPRTGESARPVADGSAGAEEQGAPSGAKPQSPNEQTASRPDPAASGPARPAETAPARPPASGNTPAAKPPAAGFRERTLYFTTVDKDGAILRTKVTRKIPLSDSPMVDALKVLIQGPSTEEQQKGLVTLIPQGTRILAARVQGTTAYISFSEEFQYNTYGVEGYAAQLRQIVWTATEFQGVKDIQILIEGRRIDYLGEGIWIGSPIGRDAL
jgi:hypothetical protein